jgi:glycosyltransferase involved in cell wall biosynthesis
MAISDVSSISVIIPTWNRSSFLLDAINSVLNQSTPVFEILVCDDGSTDSSEQLVNSIKDPRVRWIPGVHSGLPAVPRNRGIAAAKGEWIAFLDSDDVWFKRKIEVQLNYANSSGALALSTNAIINNVKDNLIKQFCDDTKSIERIKFSNLAVDNKIINSSVLIHKSLLDRIGCFSEKKSLRAIEDYDLWLRATTFTDFLYIPEPLIQYTDNIESSIRLGGVSHSRQKILILRSYSVWILKSYPCLFWKIIIYCKKNLATYFLKIYYKSRELNGMVRRRVIK